MSSRIVTAVVGAGPAGLLFCVVSRLLWEGRRGRPERLGTHLFDKRESYARSHRLRMDPEAYRAIQRDVDDPRFDRFVAFLEAEHFKPVVNRLEVELSSLASELGVSRETLRIGETGTDLAGLRAHLESDGRLAPEERLIIVGADSVHSQTRQLAPGAPHPVEHTHQHVARLRIEGEGLPDQLGVVEQFRLSKLLGSILDYRLNENGFAEVDLFLGTNEHERVVGLDAGPKAPVLLTHDTLAPLRAPFFTKIVEHFIEGFGEGSCRVSLFSTFELEHRVMPRLTFALDDIDATLCLVGDAAVSLPFFRGMACLARCAHSLAHACCDLASDVEPPDEDDVSVSIREHFFSRERPTIYGTKLMPGKIVRVEPAVFRGVPVYVVLHAWLGRYGVHVLHRDEGHWRSLHHLAPVSRRRALDDFESHLDPIQRYEAEADDIKRSEIRIVEARARLVRFVREVVRVSALVPFPIQSWFLSAEPDSGAGRATPGFAINLAIAVAAAVCALGGPSLAWLVDPAWGWLWTLGFPLHLLGGLAYYAARTVERGPPALLMNVWRVQIALVLVLGTGITASASLSTGGLAQLHSALSWLLFALAFVAGLYAFESVGARWLARAEL